MLAVAARHPSPCHAIYLLGVVTTTANCTVLDAIPSKQRTYRPKPFSPSICASIPCVAVPNPFFKLSFHQSIFDVQQDNKQLYQFVPILAEIKNLRLQFQHCTDYLSTCSRITEPIREKLFGEFHTREHLYQSIHLYSMSDLLSLKKVAAVLERACVQAKKHVHECEICCSKGFICEVCKKYTDVLYPFDELKSIGQCSRCSNIYHRQCWDNIDHDCLRCYRIIQRQSEQSLAR